MDKKNYFYRVEPLLKKLSYDYSKTISSDIIIIKNILHIIQFLKQGIPFLSHTFHRATKQQGGRGHWTVFILVPKVL